MNLPGGDQVNGLASTVSYVEGVLADSLRSSEGAEHPQYYVPWRLAAVIGWDVGRVFFAMPIIAANRAEPGRRAISQTGYQRRAA